MTRLRKLIELVSLISYMRSKVLNDGYTKIKDFHEQYAMWDHWGNRESKIKHLIIKEYEKAV